jgi:WD40 repeat protein
VQVSLVSSQFITFLAYSPDGKHFVSADRNRYIYVWDNASKEVKNSGWQFHSAAVTSVDFSPNSEKLVSGSLDGSFIIWKDLKGYSKDRLTMENAHFGGVACVSFIDNGMIVSSGDDRCVKFWNLK